MFTQGHQEGKFFLFLKNAFLHLCDLEKWWWNNYQLITNSSLWFQINWWNPLSDLITIKGYVWLRFVLELCSGWWGAVTDWIVLSSKSGQSHDLWGHCCWKQVERGHKGGRIITHDECPSKRGRLHRAGGSGRQASAETCPANSVALPSGLQNKFLGFKQPVCGVLLWSSQETSVWVRYILSFPRGDVICSLFLLLSLGTHNADCRLYCNSF